MYFECLYNLKKKIVKRINKLKIGKSNNLTFVIFIFEIPKYQPFDIWSFQMLSPTRLRSLECLQVLEWLGIHATKIFKNLVDINEYDKTTLIPALRL